MRGRALGLLMLAAVGLVELGERFLGMSHQSASQPPVQEVSFGGLVSPSESLALPDARGKSEAVVVAADDSISPVGLDQLYLHLGSGSFAPLGPLAQVRPPMRC